ncbi:MAG: hypothetical protein ACQERE_02585 [Pseudomonadota bacterium]
MKTRVCFRLFAVALIPVLAGCDLEDSTSTEGLSTCTDGTPRSAEVEYSSFTITNDQANNPENASLERTLFRKFARIAEPGDDTSNPDAADDAYQFFRDQTADFAGFNADGAPEYESVRNGFDLLEAMIASGNIGALQEARDAMANCVREDAPGSLQVDPVKVTEKAEEEGEDPETWTLGVNYAHNPEPLTDPTPFGPNIARVAFTPDSFVFTLYPNQAFEGISSSSGFKQPSKLIAGFNAAFEDSIEESDSDSQDTEDESRASVIFESFLENTQDDRGDDRSETDRWAWSFEEGTPAFSDNSDVENAKCVRITADYSGDVSREDQILVELASETCPSISSPADFEADDSLTYSSAAPDTTQARD